MKGQKAKGMSLMSLVELLVVIGIVLALIVLILSAVRIGREIAMTVLECMRSSLKRLTILPTGPR